MSKPTNPNKKSILIPLDAVLDTRLGTLARLDPEIAKAALKSGKYHTRTTDDFQKLVPELEIDMERYKTLYANRDVETLQASTITNMFLALQMVLVEKLYDGSYDPYTERSDLYLNIFPYELTDEEADTIRQAVAARVQNLADVKIIRKSVAELTPEYLKDNFSVIINYHYEDWLDAQAKAFEQTTLPSVEMLVPALYFQKEPTPAELEELLRKNMHPWAMARVMLSGIIGLNVIDVENYCIAYSTAQKAGIKPAPVPDAQSGQVQATPGAQGDAGG